MNKTLTISVIALITVVMVIGVSPAMAKEGNNGNNGCEKSNPNSKACEKNPNTDPQEKILVITTYDALGEIIPDSTCRWDTPDGSLSNSGTTTNGIVSLSVPLEVELVHAKCWTLDSNGNIDIVGDECNISLNESVTKIDLTVWFATGCFI